MNAFATSRTALPADGIPDFQFSTRPETGPVVLLRHPHGAHLHPQRWATALARALETELIVVQLLVAGGRLGSTAPTSRWQRRFGDDSRAAFVSLPSEETAGLAEALSSFSPRVVVTGFAGGWPANHITELATACGAPFLVAREPRAQRGVVAATSLDDVRLPVLHEASEWAQVLDRPLTFLHNLGAGSGKAERPRFEHQLEAFASRRGAEVALTHAYDPVSGILDVARGADADVIVVGAAGGQAGTGRVASRIAAMARRSVMVVPVPHVA